MSSSCISQLYSSFMKLRITPIVQQTRTYIHTPRYRPPKWLPKKERVPTEEYLTADNKQFIQEVIQDKYGTQTSETSPIVRTEMEIIKPWDLRTRRVGVIARKIGNYPLWLKDGTKVQTTLLQVIDNHVIKYIPPEEFKPMVDSKQNWREKRTLGCLLVGAETVDPTTVTKDYATVFNKVGMLPKRHLCRFMISQHAVLPSGTPLYATHFRVGDHLDIRAKTIDRGFQGVMKRWGFHGMPATHGVTKTHRRPGNIGAGGQKARVWPGTKMPGHMGNRWRILRGVKILRINTKYNVIWTLGVAIPGETGAMCYLYDTILPLRRPTEPPPFPTHIPTEDLPIEYYDSSVHSFNSPSISFDES